MINVLVVDDDKATVDVIKEKINWDNLGVDKVLTAYNIQQAKEILSANDVAVVISDIEMPQGTGIDLLEWYRQQDMKGEFLFLTCHESFDYATNALKLNASEYLLKPFDVVVMEAALYKILMKLAEKQRQDREIALGKWVESNRRNMQVSYLRLLLSGRMDKAESMRPEAMPFDRKYRLVLSRITDIERAKERMSHGLLSFVLENIHSEILMGNPENTRVVTMEHRDSYCLVSVCDEEDAAALESKVKEVIYHTEQIVNVSVSCCISKPVSPENFNSTYEHCEELLISSVAYYRSCFFEEKVEKKGSRAESVFDSEYLAGLLERHDKAGFMGCLKKTLGDRQIDRTLSDSMLKTAQHELWQSIYIYFAGHGMKGEDFFRDDIADSMTQKASRSVMDMMRWANFLIEQLYVYEQSREQELQPVDRIKQFVREHFAENIGRTEIAEELSLNPEYVSKLFKKETGINLTDHIANVRVEQAKRLLDKGSMSVTEVADACGFENSAYFSTIFKKVTGMTPKEYKKANE